MRIFGLKNCDTCRKAIKSLPNAALVDVRDMPLDDDMLKQALALFGEALVNTRSTTWRGLSDAERAHPPFELLRTHPALMKRPLVEANGALYLGWTKDTKAALGVKE